MSIYSCTASVLKQSYHGITTIAAQIFILAVKDTEKKYDYFCLSVYHWVVVGHMFHPKVFNCTGLYN